MATKTVTFLICVFVLLAVFSPETDAFNGANQGRPGGKRAFRKMNTFQVSKTSHNKKSVNVTDIS